MQPNEKDFPLFKASEECSVGSIPIIYAGGALLPLLSWRISSGGPLPTIQKFEHIVCCLCTLSNVYLYSVVHALFDKFYCGNNFKHKERTNIFGYGPINYLFESGLNFTSLCCSKMYANSCNK